MVDIHSYVFGATYCLLMLVPVEIPNMGFFIITKEYTARAWVSHAGEVLKSENAKGGENYIYNIDFSSQVFGQRESPVHSLLISI